MGNNRIDTSKSMDMRNRVSLNREKRKSKENERKKRHKNNYETTAKIRDTNKSEEEVKHIVNTIQKDMKTERRKNKLILIIITLIILTSIIYLISIF